MKKIVLLLMVLVIAIGLFGFLKTKVSYPEPVVDNNTPIDKLINGSNHIKIGSSNPVVLGNNKFAFNMYSRLAENGKNLFFSPFSISSALAMVYEGANGKTAKEMQNVFYFPDNLNSLRSSFYSINNDMNKNTSDYKLNIANALWVQKDYPFLGEYVSVLNKYYGAEANKVDFKNAINDAVQTINSWVENKTNNKIKNIILPNSLSQESKLVLTNAVYFNAKWDKPFDKNGTQEGNFSLGSGNNVKINMMKQNDDKTYFNYAENDTLQILEMPYLGKKLSMIVVLPRGNNISSFEKLFTFNNFNNWRKELKNQRVNVFIPQFKFDTKYSSMGATLQSMGMPTAFSADADFSKMDGTKNLSISKVIHQTFIDVNEDGTEAAAATIVNIIATATFDPGPRIPIFYANRPFLFLIQDMTNRNILFIGKVENPKAGI